MHVFLWYKQLHVVMCYQYIIKVKKLIFPLFSFMMKRGISLQFLYLASSCFIFPGRFHISFECYLFKFLSGLFILTSMSHGRLTFWKWTSNLVFFFLRMHNYRGFSISISNHFPWYFRTFFCYYRNVFTLCVGLKDFLIDFINYLLCKHLKTTKAYM